MVVVVVDENALHFTWVWWWWDDAACCVVSSARRRCSVRSCRPAAGTRDWRTFWLAESRASAAPPATTRRSSTARDVTRRRRRAMTSPEWWNDVTRPSFRSVGRRMRGVRRTRSMELQENTRAGRAGRRNWSIDWLIFNVTRNKRTRKQWKYAVHAVSWWNTHTRLTAPFPGLPGWAGTRGKTSLDFTEATDSEWQWYQLGHMQVFISLQTDNHASNPPLSFLVAGCPSCRPTNSAKAMAYINYIDWFYLSGTGSPG